MIKICNNSWSIIHQSHHKANHFNLYNLAILDPRTPKANGIHSNTTPVRISLKQNYNGIYGGTFEYDMIPLPKIPVTYVYQ